MSVTNWSKIKVGKPKTKNLSFELTLSANSHGLKESFSFSYFILVFTLQRSMPPEAWPILLAQPGLLNLVLSRQTGFPSASIRVLINRWSETVPAALYQAHGHYARVRNCINSWNRFMQSSSAESLASMSKSSEWKKNPLIPCNEGPVIFVSIHTFNWMLSRIFPVSSW